MLELHTRQVDTKDITAIKRARKNEKEQLRGDKAAKETHQLNHDRPNLRQPGKAVSHQPPVLLLSKV